MKPSLPQGTRDFSPDVLRKRYYIIDQIKKTFELYGFDPLETPAMENIETLMGKYGDEGDKLIFKILNNGLDNPSKQGSIAEAFNRVLQGKNDKAISSRALRYDLTIPFARFVATHHHELAMPFKRYQIQPVWRADRPQRGRYREFYQCDADVAGTASLKADGEFALLYRDAFNKLKLPVTIKINNRKLLTGLAEITGNAAAMKPITIAIDKLDKVGIDQVRAELAAAGVAENAVSVVDQYLQIGGSNRQKMVALKELFHESPVGLKGLEELEQVFAMTGNDEVFQLDTTLARGLDYYTGSIYEIKAKNVQIGSIGGGGRYDDLTGLFGVNGIPGVGISFGIDRIYDVMEELAIFPDELEKSSTALFFNLGEKESDFAFGLVTKCREQNIACELYFAKSKLDKQFKYAEKKGIPFAVIIGSREMEENTCKVKHLQSGREETIKCDDLLHFLKQ